MEKRKTKKTLSEKVFVTLTFLFLAFFAVTFGFMIAWMVLNSFNTASGFSSNPFGIPEWTTENIVKAMTVTSKGFNIFGMTFNSLVLIVINAVMSLTFAPMAGYVFARFNFKGKKIIISIILITVTIPMIGSTPIIYKMFVNLGLINNYLAVIILNCDGLGFGTIVFMNYYGGLTKELMEAAEIDGAGRIKIYTDIMFPQAWPMLFCNMILGIIATWNNYMTTYLYMPDYPTVAVGLQNVSVELVTYGSNYPALFSIMIYTIAFSVTIYAIFSKQITEKMVTSGLKA